MYSCPYYFVLESLVPTYAEMLEKTAISSSPLHNIFASMSRHWFVLHPFCESLSSFFVETASTYGVTTESADVIIVVSRRSFPRTQLNQVACLIRKQLDHKRDLSVNPNLNIEKFLNSPPSTIKFKSNVEYFKSLQQYHTRQQADECRSDQMGRKIRAD